MHRSNLLNLLAKHQPIDETEKVMLLRIIEFIKTNPDCFNRELLKGHITGSSWIVDIRNGKTLLAHHAKLNKWLQLGGHADGDTNILNVALKEAKEESGLKKIAPVAGRIFDVDVHKIPEYKGVQEHYHYDVRFLLEADSEEELVVSNESNDLAWIDMVSLPMILNDESLLRMYKKAKIVLGME